jgi:hypothetical protein
VVVAFDVSNETLGNEEYFKKSEVEIIKWAKDLNK